MDNNFGNNNYNFGNKDLNDLESGPGVPPIKYAVPFYFDLNQDGKIDMMEYNLYHCRTIEMCEKN